MSRAQLIVSFVAGFLLSVGISISGMISPGKVLDFLDITGNWDPTMLVVLGGAVMVSLIGFFFVLKQSKPVFAEKFMVPTLTKVDRPLVIGQILFGIGWGIVGYCPGPVFSSLALGYAEPIIVTLAIIGGALLYRKLHA
jgi:uncharacterized membrane protein YedE/YeeE